jgi:hypothetical protein
MMSEASASTGDLAASAKAAPLRAIVPMIHVSDVERSVVFYRLLGFEMGNFVPREGPMGWAWLCSSGAAGWKTGPNLMLTRNERSVISDAQGVLFYLYANELVSLRNDLIARGTKVGEISYPWYMPKGEFRVDDPDGYCLMIGQSFEDSP